jgi:hypothetical protein
MLKNLLRILAGGPAVSLPSEWLRSHLQGRPEVYVKSVKGQERSFIRRYLTNSTPT